VIVVSYGITKSGSTLAFEMAKAVLELNGSAQDRLADDLVTPGHNVNFVRGWTDERLRRLIGATEGQRVVIKTHTSPFALSADLVSDVIASGHLKVHVVFRDPRDMIVSMLDHGVKARMGSGPAFREIKTLDDAITRVGNQLPRLQAWGSFPSLRLQYEHFAFDPTFGPTVIADDFGVPVDASAVWAAVRARFTQMNEGLPERYKTDLWPEEIARIERAFPLYLELVKGNDLGWFGVPQCS
jgi:hypothetical protein